MALDPSIILGVRQPDIDPLQAKLQRAQLEQANQTRDINRMKIDEYNAMNARKARLQQLLTDTAPDQRIEALRQNGFLDEAKGLEGAARDQQEFSTKQAKDKVQLMAPAMNFLRQAPTPENLNLVLSNLRSQNIIDDKDVAFAQQNAQRDPNWIGQYSTLLFQSAIDADKQLPKYEQRDLGGTKETIAIDPISGTVKSVDSRAVTLTPDQVADNDMARKNYEETVRSHKVNEGISGGNLRVAQDRLAFDKTGGVTGVNQANAVDKPLKPLPAPALKLQQEGLDSLAIANQIDADVSSLKDKIDTGKLKLGPLTNIGSATRNWAGMSNENSRNYQTLQATVEKIRNDTLRLNKGVQTEGDAVRALNELVTNLNDGKNVSEQLQRIREINQRAATLQKNNVDSVRANYGHEPYDFSKYDNQPSVTGEKPKSGLRVPPKPAKNDGWSVKEIK